MRAALARMLGVAEEQTDDAIVNEKRAAEAVRLSRRGFFAAGATMAAAPLVPERVYSFLFAPARAFEVEVRWVGAAALGPAAWILIGEAGMLAGEVPVS